MAPPSIFHAIPRTSFYRSAGQLAPFYNSCRRQIARLGRILSQPVALMLNLVREATSHAWGSATRPELLRRAKDAIQHLRRKARSLNQQASRLSSARAPKRLSSGRSSKSLSSGDRHNAQEWSYPTHRLPDMTRLGGTPILILTAGLSDAKSISFAIRLSGIPARPHTTEPIFILAHRPRPGGQIRPWSPRDKQVLKAAIRRIWITVNQLLNRSKNPYLNLPLSSLSTRQHTGRAHTAFPASQPPAFASPCKILCGGRQSLSRPLPLRPAIGTQRAPRTAGIRDHSQRTVDFELPRPRPDVPVHIALDGVTSIGPPVRANGRGSIAAIDTSMNATYRAALQVRLARHRRSGMRAQAVCLLTLIDNYRSRSKPKRKSSPVSPTPHRPSQPLAFIERRKYTRTSQCPQSTYPSVAVMTPFNRY
jgi:hypothetical protein